MSIHKHTIKRMDATLNKMMKEISPLNDVIHMGGWDSMDNSDKKFYCKTNKRIRALNKKINHLVNDHYMT